MSDNGGLKRAAAVRAAEWIRDGMVLGLGSGSTVYFLLEEIATRRSQGVWKDIVGIPTSRHTASIADGFGIPLATLEEHSQIDLTIDGADEVDPELRLIKGLGGALLREKIIATASAEVVIVVDESKRVERLGTRAPLPVEVDPFGVATQERFFHQLGARPRQRLTNTGEPVVTDGGNYLVDCSFPDGIGDPAALELRLNNRPGVVENGLFIGLAHHVVLAARNGTEILSRGGAVHR